MSDDTREDLRDTDQKLDHLINKVGDLSVSVGKVETELCLMHKDVKENGKEAKKTNNIVNNRIRKLENWRSYLAGGLVVLTAILFVVIKIIFS